MLVCIRVDANIRITVLEMQQNAIFSFELKENVLENVKRFICCYEVSSDD